MKKVFIVFNKEPRMLLFIMCSLAVYCLFSCDVRSGTERVLAQADSLSEVSPIRAELFIDSVVSSGGRHLSLEARMRLRLFRAKARNKILRPQDTDSLREIVEYYGSHGTPNDRILSNYILGCAYMDGHDAPMAMHYFQAAVSSADTDETCCDFKTLSRVYAQMGDIQQKQLSMKNALSSKRKSVKYALLAEDTLNAISEYLHTASIYHYAGDFDSVLSICAKASELYRKRGHYDMAASAYGISFFMMADRSDTKNARRYMELYDNESGLYDRTTKFMKKGHEIHYYSKGMFYINENKLDSAEFFFRKELTETSDFNNRQAAAKGLYRLYKRYGITDSITKYAEMWAEAIDSSYAHMSTAHLQQMEAVYNYNAFRLSAEASEKDAMRYRYLLALAVIAFVVSLLFSLLIIQKRKTDKALQDKLNARNAMNLLLLKKYERELEDMRNSGIKDEKSMEKTKAEIDLLSQSVAEIHGGALAADASAASFFRALDSPVIERLHVLSGSSRKATYEDRDGLMRYAYAVMPGFMESLDVCGRKLSDTEILICVLIKLRFLTSEITCLLEISPQRLSTTRRRLNSKVFGSAGGAKDFDYRIKTQTPEN